MNRIIVTIGTACMLLMLATLAFAQESSESNKIDFGTFKPAKDGTFVEVKVSKGLINMAARITQESEPELAKIIGGLNSIRVNVLEFNDKTEKQIRERVESIRRQVEGLEWEPVVRVQEDDEDVAIYIKLEGEESIKGLVVTVISDDEAVLVHVDGRIRPEELAQVGERLGLPPLEEIGGMLK